jgi:hypothetical protein
METLHRKEYLTEDPDAKLYALLFVGNQPADSHLSIWGAAPLCRNKAAMRTIKSGTRRLLGAPCGHGGRQFRASPWLTIVDEVDFHEGLFISKKQDFDLFSTIAHHITQHRCRKKPLYSNIRVEITLTVAASPEEADDLILNLIEALAQNGI